MKARSIGGLIIGLVSALALGGNPAGAGTALGPEIVDQAGDANFANRNSGLLPALTINREEVPKELRQWPPESVVTPEDLKGADIRAMWFETAYNTVKETDDAGNITSVRYVPTALLVNIRTTEAPVPTFGPTLVFRLPARIASCEVWFEGIVSGPGSLPTDAAPQSARLRKLTSTANPCPGGNATMTAGFSISSQGNVLTMKYPFSALPYSSTNLVLDRDVVVKPQPATATTQPHVAGPNGLPNIDQTSKLAAKFRIGQDVPDNVNCVADPTNAACTA